MAKGSVGIVGLGIMGGAFARNLVAAGWRVSVSPRAPCWEFPAASSASYSPMSVFVHLSLSGPAVFLGPKKSSSMGAYCYLRSAFHF